MRYIVVGNSAAGLFAVEEIRRHDTQSELLVLTVEQKPSYSRCLTTYFLAGDIPASRLYLRNDDFAEQLNLNIIYGVNINRVNPVRQMVQSTDGREWHYDKLLFAMGSSAKKLTIPGKSLPEVFTLRTLEDAEAINKVIERGSKKAVVVGGGLVSLKCAYALRKRGLEVIVVVSSGQILSQMLDDKAAGIIENHLRANGIQFLFKTEVIAISGKDHVQVVLLSPQTELAADLVIIGKGVCPNIGELRHCGFNIGKGIQVDAFMATNLPNIYAAGDIAETWDIVRQTFTVNATWPNAATQGRIAGANMCGVHKVYPGSLSLNSVDFFGLSAMSAGITKLNKAMETGDWEEELAQGIIDGRTVYQKLIWQGDVLKGFILVGNTSQCGVLTALIKSERPLTQAQKKVALGKRGSLAAELIM